ncbi:hypothetical protein Pyn_41040 [Prunus yedoensis var. nudiflora]|uniref:Uncharacterized protein n=1 Tax=Prunus yedoensis var. nudiflora TaxID=2094558 RepID=A0A314UVG6_PRUYE|nr:hypothetical protein Pyn_41040 [Prunus yedoensis var. nudiflora]
MARSYAPKFFAPPPQLSPWKLGPRLRPRPLLQPKEGPPPWVRLQPGYSVEKARQKPFSLC